MRSSKHPINLNYLFSRNELVNLIENIPEPLCIIQGDDQQQPEKIIYANKKAEELLLLSRVELSQYTLEQLLGIPRNVDWDELEEKHKDEPLHHDETPLKKHLDGRALKVNLEPFTTDDDKTYFLLTIVDATDLQETRNQLKKLSTEFDSLFEHSQDIVFALNSQGDFISINGIGLEKLGYLREDLLGLNIEILISKDSREEILENTQKIFDGKIQNLYTQLLCHDSRLIDVQITVIPLVSDGEIIEILGVAKDISDSIETNLRLKESEEMYRALFENSKDIVVTLDLNGHLLTCNKATEVIMGIHKELLIGVYWLEFLNENRKAEAWEEFKGALKGKTHQYETSFVNKVGNEIHLHMSLIPGFVKDEVKYIHCIAKDITSEKSHDDMMYKMVYYDHLTGLKNQRSFLMDLRGFMDSASSNIVRVWIIDMDRFKFLNDYLGHDRGDRILKTISERVMDIIGDRGQFYRYGGKAFALLTPNLSEMEIKLLAFQLISQISTSYDVQGFKSLLTASIGVSTYPQDGDSIKEILNATNQALDHAKVQGKNQFQIYNSIIKRNMDLDIKMELLLAEAVEKGEFILHYQPQFKARTNELYGVEALIRWDSPELGFVAPGDFIPLAEETGEIMRIGEWVIEQACLQHVEWKRQGFSPIPISINLSIRQFYQNNFVKRVRSIVQNTGIDPSFIMFEITETIAMQEEIALLVLNELKEIGFKVAMDDFGTGYSSLKYIQTFAMDHLKIDKAFIDKIGTKEGKAIVATIISLGQHLDMKIVAEGVETAIQVQVLEQLKCDFFQGYYFGKPLPAHGLETQYLT